MLRNARAESTLPPAPARPQDVIIDTDIGYDIDDAQALAVALRLQELGYIRIRAITTSTRTEAAPSCVETFLRYGGMTSKSIPVGAYQGNALPTANNYAQQTVEALKLAPLKSRSQFPDAVTVLRQQLNAADGGTLTLITLGPLTNVAALMKSGSAADGLNVPGTALWGKLKSVVIMGGYYNPAVPNAEYNFATDKAAADFVFPNSSGVPIYGCGAEVGGGGGTNGSIVAGAAAYYALQINGTPPDESVPQPGDSPLYAAIYFFRSAIGCVNRPGPCGGFRMPDAPYTATGFGRVQYDPATVLFAAIGTTSASGGPYFRVSANGTNTVTGGVARWSPSPESGHYYVAQNRPHGEFENLLETLQTENYLQLKRRGPHVPRK